MNDQIMYEFEQYGIDVLDFFKLKFDQLIDPNIISIRCNQDGIHVFKIDFKEDKNIDNARKFVDRLHVAKNPIGITISFLHWKDVFNQKGKYPFELEYLMSDVFFNNIPFEEKRRLLGSHLEDILNDFEPNLVESIRLFGDSDYIYRLYKTDYEQNSWFEKYDELEAKNAELEDNYNEMAEYYKTSVKYLLKNSKEICSKPALVIFKRLEKQLRTSYQTNGDVIGDKDEGIETRWDELGKWRYDGTLTEIAKSDVESDAYVLYKELNHNEKLAVIYDSLDLGDFEIDSDQVIDDIEKYQNVIESFIEPMVRNLLSEALDDWSNKVWH